MRARLVKTVSEAENIKSFYFEPERPLQYTAGQFAEWKLPHDYPDKRGQKRWFTISSSPIDKHISLTTKFNPEGSSFKRALRGLKPGDEIIVSEAMGDFVLPKLIQTPLVFVAGGIGITPFHSIFNWLSATGEQRPIHFIYGVNTEEEIIFQDSFAKLGVHPVIVVNKPSSAWGGEHGQLSAELVLGIAKPNQEALIYVSGPEPMVENLQKQFRAAGLKSNQFVGDFFPNYKEV